MRNFQFPGRSPVYSDNAMAATSMPAATLAALDVMRTGGNAIDAAVTAAALLGVIEPQSTGIGGDCFCLLTIANRPGVIALNGSGRAPAGATIDFFEARNMSEISESSPHAVTVPGALSAWETLLKAHGTRSLAQVLQPAIDAAENGMIVHDRVAWDWRDAEEKLRAVNSSGLLPQGSAPAAGSRFSNLALAQTLRNIAQHGAAGFYRGHVARVIVSYLRERGGRHTEEDFAAGEHVAEFVEPIKFAWRDFEIWQCPPNGAGVIPLMMAGILAAKGKSNDEPFGVGRFHQQIEAARLAFRDRDAFIADPQHSHIPVDHLLSSGYLKGLSQLIRDDARLHNLPAEGELVLPRHKDTVYLCTVDRDGNTCSFINSLFDDFGGGLFAGDAGIVLHNRGSGFRVSRGHPNCIGPGKRPLHTILPALLTRDGAPVMTFGVTGGHYQPTGQVSFLNNIYDYGLDVQAALDAPRAYPLHEQVLAEYGVPDATFAGLEGLGHRMIRTRRPLGGGQAILIDRSRGVLMGGSDPRRDGFAAGF